MIIRLAASLILLISLIIPDALYADQTVVRRFAMIVGTNDGGSDRITLRYADSDAEAMARVLEELGGVSPKDRTLLLDADKAELYRAFADMAAQMLQAKEEGFRVEFFFYYSGHSDENGLLLYGRHVDYRDLKRKINELPGDIRVVILDSCSSGALTRTKGGRRLSPFMVDQSINLKGHAYLTSAAANEAAQESDRIGGSFFTHYLVSGLRGAADHNNDRRVSLNEAYQHAYAETLGRTETTESGAQHPTYSINLSGTGDLVLTAFISTSAALAIDENIRGRIYLRDADSRLVAELNKTRGRAIELGLESGSYRVVVDNGGRFSTAEIEVAEGAQNLLLASDLEEVDSESTIARGLGKEEKKYSHAPFNIGLFPPAHVNRAYKSPVLNNFSLGLFASYQDKLEGFGFAFGTSWQADDMIGVHGSMFFNVTEGSLTGVGATIFTNIVIDDSTGLLWSVFYNHTGRHLRGASAAMVNYTGGNLTGAQAGMVNVTIGASTGAQAALVNWSTDGSTGVQFGLLNLTRGESIGFRFGLFNFTEDRFTGAELGLFNIAATANNTRQSTGAQVGMFNYSAGRVRGTQIGFINYAKDVDAPIGALSIVEHPRLQGVFWTSDTGIANVGIKLGTRYVYNILSFSGQVAGDTKSYGYAFGIGGHIPVREKFFIEIDTITLYSHTKDDLMHGVTTQKLRVIFGWQITQTIALVGGPTLNLGSWQQNTSGLDANDVSYIPQAHTSGNRKSGLQTTVGPGFMLGVQIGPERL